MCADRGYEIDALVDAKYREEESQRERGATEAPPGETLHPITSYLEMGKQALGAKILFQKLPEPGQGEPGRPELILVFFAGRTDTPQVKLASINDAIREISQKRAIKEAVIIVDRVLSTEAQKAIVRLTPAVRIQVFRETELMFLPIDHVLTPRYERIPDAEVPALLEELRVKKPNLPIIRRSDPIVKYYNWPQGTVVRVIRELFVPDFLAPVCVNYAHVK